MRSGWTPSSRDQRKGERQLRSARSNISALLYKMTPCRSGVPKQLRRRRSSGRVLRGCPRNSPTASMADAVRHFSTPAVAKNRPTVRRHSRLLPTRWLAAFWSRLIVAPSRSLMRLFASPSSVRQPSPKRAAHSEAAPLAQTHPERLPARTSPRTPPREARQVAIRMEEQLLVRSAGERKILSFEW